MPHVAGILKAGLTIIALAGASTALEAQERTLILNEGRGITISVSYADLNIGSPEGRRQLEERVGGAVDRVCHKPNGRVTLTESMQFRACRKAAIEQADALIQARIEQEERAAR